MFIFLTYDNDGYYYCDLLYILGISKILSYLSLRWGAGGVHCFRRWTGEKASHVTVCFALVKSDIRDQESGKSYLFDFLLMSC